MRYHACVFIAVPILIVVLLVAVMADHRAGRWVAVALALILGMYLGDTGFGHFVRTFVTSL